MSTVFVIIALHPCDGEFLYVNAVFEDREQAIVKAKELNENSANLMEIKEANYIKAGEVDTSTVWYIRDNHTTLKLSLNIDEALSQLKKEFLEGYTHGMICCTEQLVPLIHAKGSETWKEFKEAVKEYYINNVTNCKEA
jgi:hypothetical protein